MKNRSVCLYLLTATLFGVLALAQDGASPAPRPPDESHPVRAEVLKRFDANQDGQLDDTERALARAAWQKRRAEHPGTRSGLDRAGWGGPLAGGDVCWGREKLQQYHRSQYSRRMQLRLHHLQRQKLIQRFDADHDGRLSDTERAGAKQTLAAFRDDRRNRRHEILERFDRNGDGQLDETERASARQARQEFLKHYPIIARGAPVPAAPAK